MSFEYYETTFPSSDGRSTVNAEIYAPRGVAVRGVVQLSHGMIDHVSRYKGLAEYLTSRGFVFAGNDHLGHGKTAKEPSEYGFFAERDGVLYVLRDLHTMNKYLRNTYPEVPLILFGHSMGSFLSRLYVERHPHSISGHIIHGTGGPNRLLPLGKSLVGIMKLLKGSKYRSKMIAGLAFSGYNSRFDKSEGKNAWLTRDVAAVSNRDDSGMTDFIFTLSAYRDLFRMVGDSNSKAWFSAYPKELPTLVMSGKEDPVGAFGKGPDYVYKQLLVAGCGNVAIKMYEGARHELFNEINKEEVFSDITDWINGVIDSK